MTFPQTAHAFNPDDAIESACDFQNFRTRHCLKPPLYAYYKDDHPVEIQT